MDMTCSFQFKDNELNRQLIASMKKAKISHFVDKEGVVHFAPADEEVVENELIASIRNEVFPSWQVLTCPNDCIAQYQHYMNAHGIPFTEEYSNNQNWFLIPSRYRPYRWKLAGERAYQAEAAKISQR